MTVEASPAAETTGMIRPGDVGDVLALEQRPPPEDLAHLIEFHWIVTWDLRGRAPRASPVLPHPTVHVVFESDGPWVYGVPGGRFSRTLSGAGRVIGTKFRPAGFAAFTPRPVSDLFARRVRPDVVFGTAGEALTRGHPDPSELALDALLGLLRARREPRREPAIAVAQAVVADMAARPPGASVPDLAAGHHLSTRALQRLFRQTVGVSPKWVLQRLRLHDALERIRVDEPLDWPRLALDLGYYDQAHFARDFRALVGVTPAQFARGRSQDSRGSGRAAVARL